MCLITEQKRCTRTKEDMSVYKVMGYCISEQQKVKALYNWFFYKFGTLYKTKIVKSSPDYYTLYADTYVMNFYHKRDDSLTVVKEGFHSYTTFNRILMGCSLDLIYNSVKKKVIVECTIPKGSLIIKDRSGLIVSDQIIINHLLSKEETMEMLYNYTESKLDTIKYAPKWFIDMRNERQEVSNHF